VEWVGFAFPVVGAVVSLFFFLITWTEISFLIFSLNFLVLLQYIVMVMQGVFQIDFLKTNTTDGNTDTREYIYLISSLFIFIITMRLITIFKIPSIALYGTSIIIILNIIVLIVGIIGILNSYISLPRPVPAFINTTSKRNDLYLVAAIINLISVMILVIMFCFTKQAEIYWRKVDKSGPGK
jgi:hypothetical protein